VRSLALAALAALVAPSGALAGDATLLRALRDRLPAAVAADRAGVASPDAAQSQYDAARSLEEAARRAGPVSRGCARLLRATLTYARGLIQEAEGIDRLSPRLGARGRRRASLALDGLESLGRLCSVGRPRPAPPRSEPIEPRDGAAFFGLVRDTPAVGATEARLYVDRVLVARGPAPRFRLHGRPRELDLEVRQLRGGRVLRRAFAGGVWLLPPSARRAHPVASSDASLGAHLAGLGRRFDGYAGFWVHDLSSGRSAGWNSDARFPAASTVKLGVLLEAVSRFDPRRSGLDYDLRALAGWSSNLAANRLLEAIGGPRRAEAALWRLGARSSTYPGPYRVGTSAAGDIQKPPPPVTSRVTTARDLGRVLARLQAAAVGRRAANRASGLGVRRARYALGLLLASQPVGANVGLLRPGLPRVPMAQKNGWTSSVRHTAAIVYRERGPTIVVVLTYRPGLRPTEARALGRRLVDAVF
jgi:hypothetical protein